MASIVTTTVLHVPTGYVTDRTDIAHMDVLRAFFVAHCLSSSFFGHCIIGSYSIYSF
jgi:hypothetical protein